MPWNVRPLWFIVNVVVRRAIVVLLALLFGCPTSCDRTEPAFEGDDPCRAPRLYDAQGGVLVLRGANLSSRSKWTRDNLPPQELLDFGRLRADLGLNAVRLLIFWQAIEPNPGMYDEAYLAAVREIVDRAGQAGLWVLVDMHQDIFGDEFGQAGAPAWAGLARSPVRDPSSEPWFADYLSPEVTGSFDQLYQDPRVVAAFAAAWARVVASLQGASNLIAYDLLNEPFWGSSSAQRFEREIAPKFYPQVIDVIRDVDPYGWIAFEPTVTASVGVPTELGRLERDRLIYAPHFYPPSVEVETVYGGNRDTLIPMLGAMCADARRLRTPLLIGEVGARRNTQRLNQYLRDAYDLFDSAQISAFYWDLSAGGATSYGLLAADGELSLQGKELARPYVARTAGKPIRWHWRVEAGVFEAEWIEDGSALGSTVVILPAQAFPHGSHLEITPPGPVEERLTEARIAQVGARRKLRIVRR